MCMFVFIACMLSSAERFSMLIVRIQKSGPEKEEEDENMKQLYTYRHTFNMYKIPCTHLYTNILTSVTAVKRYWWFNSRKFAMKTDYNTYIYLYKACICIFLCVVAVVFFFLSQPEFCFHCRWQTNKNKHKWRSDKDPIKQEGVRMEHTWFYNVFSIIKSIYFGSPQFAPLFYQLGLSNLLLIGRAI